MLTVDFSYDDVANTVPYPLLFDSIRRNHGFVDVRGRPDLAAQIVEAGSSPALRELLVRLAAKDAPLTSLRCDLGEHEPEQYKFVAGGYLQWILAPPAFYEPEVYEELADALAHELDAASEEHSWQISFVMKFVDLKLDDVGLVPSQWLWFDADADTPSTARNSRESLLGSLARATSVVDFAKLSCSG